MVFRSCAVKPRGLSISQIPFTLKLRIEKRFPRELLWRVPPARDHQKGNAPTSMYPYICRRGGWHRTGLGSSVYYALVPVCGRFCFAWTYCCDVVLFSNIWALCSWRVHHGFPPRPVAGCPCGFVESCLMSLFGMWNSVPSNNVGGRVLVCSFFFRGCCCSVLTHGTTTCLQPTSRTT